MAIWILDPKHSGDLSIGQQVGLRLMDLEPVTLQPAAQFEEFARTCHFEAEKGKRVELRTVDDVAMDLPIHAQAQAVVNGIDYHFDSRTLSFDGQGHETTSATATSDSTTLTCNWALQSGDHVLPWWVGQAWALTTQETCGSDAPMTITESGSVVSLESVTVPAGTFTALKLQYNEHWTDSNGQQVTQTVTRWTDPTHWLFTLKAVIAYTRSGNVPAHFVASETIELQSRSEN